MEELGACPVCNSTSFERYLECRDHSISGEQFTLVKCLDCSFVFTNPRPPAHEIGPYYSSEAYISHHADKSGLIPFFYRKIRNVQFEDKTRIIKSFGKQQAVLLDIGCGTGDFIAHCTSLGWNCTGVEPDPGARLSAQKKSLNVLDLSYLESCNAQFDVITMWHVLEHVHELEQRMQQLKRLIKNDGIIIIAVPNLKSFDAKYYKEFWAAYDVPRHLYHFSKATITRLFGKYSLQLKKTYPMVYDAFYVSMKSEEYKHGKSSGILKGPWVGLISHLFALKTGEFSSLIYVFKP
jgi:2-polyprenyl-3-methyl-5-hydroxy-6-metoxy-1,4-benzoquinol methylase